MLDLGMDRSRPLVAVLPEPSAEPSPSHLGQISKLSVQVKGLTVAQFPNAPLAVWLIAKVVGSTTSGSTQHVAQDIGLAALAVWAALELVSGINWFRRGLGLMVLIGITMAWAQ